MNETEYDLYSEFQKEFNRKTYQGLTKEGADFIKNCRHSRANRLSSFRNDMHLSSYEKYRKANLESALNASERSEKKLQDIVRNNPRFSGSSKEDKDLIKQYYNNI